MTFEKHTGTNISSKVFVPCVFLRESFRVGCLLTFLLLQSIGATGQTSSDRWNDYAPAEYDIFPNVTYAKASNFELKLDLYLPKNRTRPNPTLILFHGGGWVDGQKERNVLYLLPYLELG